MSKPITVTYKVIDGAHFFVSDDKVAAGLCVAHGDLKVAFEEVGKQLSILFKVNHGMDCTFSAAVPFETFKSAVDAANLVARGADQSGMIVPSMIQPWMAIKPGA